ncbi:MAG: class I SAM-dependent methyltransferase [Chloroflexota bacterium]
MDEPITYSFPRYLAAKKSVDDRALNQHVWRSLSQALPVIDPDQPLRVLEIGCGIGTMFERMLDWDLLNYAEYTGLDAQAENIVQAQQRLPEWAHARGYQTAAADPEWLEFQQNQCRVRLYLEAINLFDFIARQRGQQRWDLLVAHAFLDLMDIPATLPALFELVEPGGLFYFTINFDGATLFEPAIDPALDEHIQALYHRSMDERITSGKRSGDSRAGRRLFTHLQRAGTQVLDAGSSDWVVFPQSGCYPQDEAYFLHFILDTLQQALSGHPELDEDRFADWVTERHAQVRRGELIYIAHQIDFLGRTPPATPR